MTALILILSTASIILMAATITSQDPEARFVTGVLTALAVFAIIVITADVSYEEGVIDHAVGAAVIDSSLTMKVKVRRKE